MKRVLLTGAGGFVGHHTLEHLLVNTDWEIVCLDSFRHRGKTDRLREVLDGRSGSEKFIDGDRVQVLTHDLRVPISAQLDHEIGRIDYVISMASESHVDRSCVEPRPFIENNVALVLTLLEWMRGRKEKLDPASPVFCPEKFLHVSTDEVYGAAVGVHNHYEGEPHRPSNPYSASKAAQEDIIYSYWRTFRLPVAVSNCWDMETRLLTEDGLRGYDEVEVGTKVWTLDGDERMVLVPVLDKVKLPSPGRMVIISGHAEQVVTPNHRMMLRESTGSPRRWGGITETPAAALLQMSGRYAIPRNGSWEGEEREVTRPPGQESYDSHWLARIFGWFITEGCVSGTTVALGAGSEGQARQMEALLAGWGNVYRNGRSVRVANRELADLLSLAGSGAREKRIPSFIRELSRSYLAVFLDAAIDGDGTRYGSGGVIYTISEKLAADYAEVAMKCGYAVRISERDTRHPRKDEMVHSYIVRLSRRADSMIESRNVSDEPSEGDVWCVSVETGRVFAEHGGAISLTGQTMNIIGERQDPEKFVPLVIRAVARGDTVKIHAGLVPSTGEMRAGSRFYLHARNQADALLFLLRTQPFPRYGEAKDPTATMARWNVVGEREVDNLDMAQMIAAAAGHELRYELTDFHSSRPGHDLRYALDGTKLASLGWTPPVPLEESLEATVRWTLEHRHWLL